MMCLLVNWIFCGECHSCSFFITIVATIAICAVAAPAATGGAADAAADVAPDVSCAATNVAHQVFL